MVHSRKNMSHFEINNQVVCNDHIFHLFHNKITESQKSHVRQLVIQDHLVVSVAGNQTKRFGLRQQKNWNVWEIQHIVHSNPNHPKKICFRCLANYNPKISIRLLNSNQDPQFSKTKFKQEPKYHVLWPFWGIFVQKLYACINSSN